VAVGSDVAVWLDVGVVVAVGVAVADDTEVGSRVMDGVAVTEAAWPGGVTAIGSREEMGSTRVTDGCGDGDAGIACIVDEPSASGDTGDPTTGEAGTGVADSIASGVAMPGVAIGVALGDGSTSGWGDAASGEPLEVASPAAVVGDAAGESTVAEGDAARLGVASTCGGATIRGVSVAEVTDGEPFGSPISVLGEASARIAGADSVAARSAASWVNTGGATVTTISRGVEPDRVRSNAMSRLTSMAPVATIALVRFTPTSPSLDNRLPAPSTPLVRWRRWSVRVHGVDVDSSRSTVESAAPIVQVA
jgi:hypothetical protein